MRAFPTPVGTFSLGAASSQAPLHFGIRVGNWSAGLDGKESKRHESIN